jgi:NADP-dependent alcohol dehydrogenase
MNNFDYYNPTRILFGKDRLGEIDGLVPANNRAASVTITGCKSKV